MTHPTIEQEAKLTARELYDQVMQQPDSGSSLDLIYQTCDAWHHMGLFNRTDEIIEMVLEHGDEWLVSNVVALSLLSISLPAYPHLTQRTRLYHRLHDAYRQHTEKNFEDIMVGLLR